MKIISLLKSFFCNKYPDNLKFSKGQKVMCSVTHEVSNSRFDTAIILNWVSKNKSYWAFSDIPSDWYKVKFIVDGKEIILPQERIEDFTKYSERMKEFLKNNEHRVGEKGYSLESYTTLKQSLSK